MHIWNQLEPAPYDGMYSFPSVIGISPTTGKPITPTGYTTQSPVRPQTITGTNCTICVGNPDTTDVYRNGLPMLPPGKYVVEVVMLRAYEVEKEEDKNILIGDNYIGRSRSSSPAWVGTSSLCPTKPRWLPCMSPAAPVTTPTTRRTLPEPGDVADHRFRSRVPRARLAVRGESRIIPDYLSLFPQSQEVRPLPELPGVCATARK